MASLYDHYDEAGLFEDIGQQQRYGPEPYTVEHMPLEFDTGVYYRLPDGRLVENLTVLVGIKGWGNGRNLKRFDAQAYHQTHQPAYNPNWANVVFGDWFSRWVNLAYKRCCQNPKCGKVGIPVVDTNRPMKQYCSHCGTEFKGSGSDGQAIAGGTTYPGQRR